MLWGAWLLGPVSNFVTLSLTPYVSANWATESASGVLGIWWFVTWMVLTNLASGAMTLGLAFSPRPRLVECWPVFVYWVGVALIVGSKFVGAMLPICSEPIVFVSLGFVLSTLGVGLSMPVVALLRVGVARAQLRRVRAVPQP